MVLRCLALALFLPTAALAQTDFFGASVASLGDLDGDGVAEFAVGAHGSDWDGVVYVYSGATGQPWLNVALNADSPEPTTYLNGDARLADRWTLRAAPDINGDGIADFYVGDPLAGLVLSGRLTTTRGRAFAFDGLTGQMLHRLDQPGEGDGRYTSFGRAITRTGDIDSDGTDDVLVGALRAGTGNGNSSPGRVLVLSGATGDVIRTDLGEGTRYGPFSGVPRVALGDIDGDGVRDYYANTAEYINAAMRHIIVSGATGETVVGRDWAPAQSDPPRGLDLFLGWASAPDQDDDGLDDLVSLTAPYSDDVILCDPCALSAYSSATLERVREIPIPDADEKTQVYDFAVDGDRAAVRVKYDALGPQVFRVLSIATGEPLVTLAPPSDIIGYDFGSDVEFIPDVNGDGVNDLLVGAARESGSGLAFVFSGADGTELRRLDAASSVVVAPPVPTGPLAIRVGPNPVHGTASLRFVLTAAQTTRATAHDVLGREVAVLTDAARRAGEHTVYFDTAGWASGVYVVRLATADGARTTRLTVVR